MSILEFVIEQKVKKQIQKNSLRQLKAHCWCPYETDVCSSLQVLDVPGLN